MNVGRNIKKYMKLKGLKQSWLAEQLHVSDSNLSMLLNAKDMKVSTYISICNVLGVNTNIFLETSSNILGIN
jgi:DNA-binding Xre family transcriptional regulator